MKDKFSVFGLTAEQSEVLFALQRKLTSNDVLVEGQKKPFIGSNKKGQKQLWLDTYEQVTGYVHPTINRSDFNPFYSLISVVIL